MKPETTLVLLPGLDGTGRLFKPFTDICPPWLNTIVISYPADRDCSYDDLTLHVIRQLPDSPCIILGESFSGPIALKAACQRSESVSGVVLAASFIRSPVPDYIRYLLKLPALPAEMFACPAHFALLNTFRQTPVSYLLKDVLTSVPDTVIKRRIEAVLTVDETDTLRTLNVPLLCIRALRDRIVTRQNPDYIKSVKPSVAVCDIDAPHLVLQTKPELCRDRIISFTNSINSL